MKRIVVILIVFFLLSGTFYVLWQLYRNERQERLRLEANQHSLLSETRYYRTHDSLSAAGTERLTLSNREFRKHCTELEKTIEALNLKIRRLESVSRTAVSTVRTIETTLRDTVILRDTLPADTLQTMNFRDPWLTINGSLHNRLFSGRIETRDTLIQAVHRILRRFWFIRWGTKAVRQEVTTRNPYSRITYTEYIELKRRKK